MKQKIAIILIGIGRYSELLYDLIESVIKNANTKEFSFVVFTDKLDFVNEKLKDYEIITINWQDEGWPWNTLLRYRMIWLNKDSIMKLKPDIVLFMNANLRIISPRLFYEIEKEDFFYVKHPGYHLLKCILPKPFHTGRGNAGVSIFNKILRPYVQGTLWGGQTKIFFNAIEWLYMSVEFDINNGIFGKVDDGSYLNAFRIKYQFPHKLLSTSYSWPENWLRFAQADVISIDKKKIFGEKFLSDLKSK